MELNEFTSILWRERRLLELLVFKLGEEKLVVGTGRSDWLVHATREVDAVATELKSIEPARAAMVASLCVSFGLRDAPSLAELAASAPSPWKRILEEHRAALLDLLDEVHAVARAGRGMPAAMSPEWSLKSATERAEARPAAVDRSSVASGSAAPGDAERGAAGGTLDVIVEQIRGLGAAAAVGLGGSASTGLQRAEHVDDGDELARVAVGLQLEEIAQAHATPSPIRVIQASLVEFLR